MKYTFVDNYDSFEDVKVGEVFSLVNDSTYPQTTLFMKLPVLRTDRIDGEYNTYNAICLCGNKMFYICSKQQVVIHDAELIVRK